MKRTIAIGLFAVLLGSSHASAQAPAALRGKSVIASWTEERIQRVGGIGDFSGRSFGQQLKAYISSEGRIFARRTVFAQGRRGRPHTGEANSVGDNSGGSQSAMMSGRSLIITTRFGGGMRMARIEFSADFASCNANVILGRENGGVARGRSLTNGERLEIKEAHVSNTSCAIQDGNVFGQ